MKKNEEILEESLKEIISLIKTTQEARTQIIMPLMPMTKEKIINLSLHEKLLMDALVSRYSKIQDMLSNKIFMLFLKAVGEKIDGLTFIDVLNRLEKLHVLPSMYRWKDLRDLRNHLAHEYPDRPDLMAGFLNQAYEAIPELIAIFETIDQRLKALQ